MTWKGCICCNGIGQRLQHEAAAYACLFLLTITQPAWACRCEITGGVGDQWPVQASGVWRLHDAAKASAIDRPCPYWMTIGSAMESTLTRSAQQDGFAISASLRPTVRASHLLGKCANQVAELVGVAALAPDVAAVRGLANPRIGGDPRLHDKYAALLASVNGVRRPIRAGCLERWANACVEAGVWAVG